MYRIGLSCGAEGKELNKETFLGCQRAGISAMEISLLKSQYKYIDYQNLKKLSEEYGVELWSFHLPFSVSWNINIASVEKGVRQSTVSYFKELIGKASDIGIDKIVIHPSCGAAPDVPRQLQMEYSKENLDYLAEYASSCGAVLAIEDLPGDCLGHDSTEMLELLSANDKLRVCFDTNHLLQENVVDFVKNVGDKIITTHISDCDFVNERHWLPGEGKINWSALIDALQSVNYSGVWMYEIGFKAPASIKRERDLTFEDFVHNAEQLFK